MATGAVQYLMIGAGYTTPLGIVTGGDFNEDTNPQTRTGIGGVGVIVPGSQTPTLTFDLLPTDTAVPITEAFRASYPNGAMTALSLEHGDDGKGRRFATYYVNSMNGSCGIDEALSMSFELLATGIGSATAGGVSYTSPTTTFEWYRGTATFAGSALLMQNFSWDMANNLMPVFSLDTVVAGSKRFPTGMNLGPEVVTGSCEVLTDHGYSTFADELTTATIAATFVNNAGSAKTITVTATSAKIVKVGEPFVNQESDLVYQVDWALDHNSGNFSVGIA